MNETRACAWECSGCGAPYPNRIGECDCPTMVVFRLEGKRLLHETKNVGEQSDENYRRCTYCGFIVDLRWKAEFR